MRRAGIGMAIVVAACSGDVDVDLARVEAPRVLAIAAAPAEAEPGAAIELTALVGDGDGTIRDAELRWDLCTARRPLAELGPVARACLDGSDDALVPLGTTATIAAELPDDACRLFGPDPPPAAPGEPAGRPVDPDRTGGYYQPIRAAFDDEITLAGVRLACGVAGATQQQSAELTRRHRDNVAPMLELVRGSELIDTDRIEVTVGERVDLVARWAACPRTPTCGDGSCTLDEDPGACADDCSDARGCTGAEWYVRYDAVDLAVVAAREAIGVTWFTTAGELAEASNGRAADDETTQVRNRWTAPDAPGSATLWVVVRDDRGAVSWRELAIDVVP